MRIIMTGLALYNELLFEKIHLNSRDEENHIFHSTGSRIQSENSPLGYFKHLVSTGRNQ
jgi:hypothetical protein